MGAIAEAFAAFAQPLLDQTDGSIEEMNKAFMFSQVCYNLAQLPEEAREEMLDDMQQQLAMNDEEFAEFRHGVVEPMIERHDEMFGQLPALLSAGFRERTRDFDESPRVARSIPLTIERPEVTDRYAPCPCNSGKKYKFCCGAKRR